MTVAASLVVEISGRDVNLAALLQRVQAQLQQANTAGTRTAGVLGGPLTTSQERAANSALALAAAYSRLALAEGDPARAASILRTALDANGAASERLQVSLQATATRLETGRTAFQQFGDAAKGSLLSIVGPAALVATAMGAATKIVASFGEAFKFKAELDATRTAIEAQLHGVRDSGQAFSQAAVFADRYKLTQQEVTQALQASVGIMRQSKSSVEDILGTLARLRVASPEQSLEGAALALKELAGGDITSLVGRFEISRTAANKMKEEIKGGADAVQVLSKYLDSAGISMGTLESQTTGAMGAMRDYARATEDLKLAQADFAQGPGVAFLGAATAYLHEFTNVARGELSPVLRDAGAAMGALQAQAIGTAASFIQTGDASKASEAGLVSMVLAFLRASGAIPPATAATQQHTSATSTNSGAQAQLAAQIAAATAAVATHAAEVAAAAQEAVNDAYAKQEQSAATEVLRQKTDDTVQSFLNLYPALTAQELAGLAAARGYSAAEVKLITMAGAARDATNALIVLHNQMNAVSVGAAVAASRASGRIGRGDSSDMRDMAAGNKAYADALQEQIDKTGTAAEKQRALNYEVQKAKLYHGETSAEYVRAKTALDAYTASEEKHGRAAKGARSGATKLSDQTKLNNSLLAQQEKADSQLEDLELKHQKALLKIERDYQQKSLAQQKANEISKRKSRFDFYTSIGDLDTKSQQTLSAEYETAFAESQRIAQAGNRKLAADYLAMRQKQIEADRDYYAKRTEIEKSDASKGDKEAQLKRLDDLRRLRKEEEAEELKQLQEGGDAINEEHARQIQEETDTYSEQTGRIETAAQRKADATVQAEIRSGKAIDVTNLKLKEQEDRLNRIGQAAGGGAPAAGAPTQGTGSPAAPVPAVAPAVGAGGDMAAVVGALQAAQAAIVDALGRVERAEQGTTGAVRGLRTAGGLAG